MASEVERHFAQYIKMAEREISDGVMKDALEIMTARDGQVCDYCCSFGDRKLTLEEAKQFKPHKGCRCCMAFHSDVV